MSPTLTAAQLTELKGLLHHRRQDLQAQMPQNMANLAPADQTAGPDSQDDNVHLANQTREVNTALTNLDLLEITRIDRALEAMDDGTYGDCESCGCHIPFARLQAEPMTQHCVPCKEKLEQQAARG